MPKGVREPERLGCSEAWLMSLEVLEGRRIGISEGMKEIFLAWRAEVPPFVYRHLTRGEIVYSGEKRSS